MEERPDPNRREELPPLFVVELAVYLMSSRTLPGVINPEFLRFNEISEPSWEIGRPLILGSDHAHVSYSNGTSVVARRDYISFRQSAPRDTERSLVTPLEPDDILCVGMAERYLNTLVADGPYEIVSIDPSGWIEIPRAHFLRLSSPLLELARRVPSGGTTPTVQARVSYDLPGKEIILYISETLPAVSDEVVRLHIAGEILHGIPEEMDSPPSQIEFILRTLGNWKRDIQEFNELCYGFYSLYTGGEV